MENFTTENRYVELYNEVRAVIKCMKAVFYRPDYQKLLMCPLIKHAAKPLKHLTELLKHSAELLKHSAGLLRI